MVLDQYQLVGITALFIACKLEEIYYPKITEFEEITDNKYTSGDIFEMEIKMFTRM